MPEAGETEVYRNHTLKSVPVNYRSYGYAVRLYHHQPFRKGFSMNKGELIVAVAKDLGGSKAQAEKAVNSVLATIKKNVKKGVNIIGFGSFNVGTRKARMGRNPQTGATIKIKASKTVRFKAGKALKSGL